jgi:hypothetical protein
MPVFTSVAALGATVGGALSMAGPLTFGTSLALGAGTLAAGGGALYGLSKALSPDIPSAPSSSQSQGPSAAQIQSQAEAKAKEDVDKRRKAQARNKTTYTSPVGLTPADKSDLNLKTLTGA